MTHRLEAAAAAAAATNSFNNDLYYDPDTGGTVKRTKPDSIGKVESIPLRNLDNRGEQDGSVYEQPDELGTLLAAIEVVTLYPFTNILLFNRIVLKRT